MTVSDPRASSLWHHESFVAGRWVAGAASYKVVDPGNGEAISEVAGAGEELAIQAVDAASAAGVLWARRTAGERSALLHRFADAMAEREAELAAILTLEHGKPLSESAGEIRYAASFVRWFAEEARRLRGEVIPANQPDRQLLVMRQPLGVGAGITPWNFPSAMITRKLAPALAAGCTFVLKPAETTPHSALALAALMQEVGFPDGVFNVVVGPDPAALTAPWMKDSRVRKLSFTGSTDVGRHLYAQSAPTLKRLALELGGNAPFIVFEDADLDAAVDGAMKAKFRNGGQSCVAANRFLVHRDVHQAFAERLAEAIGALQVGYGFDEGSEVGPLIDERAVTKVAGLVDDAIAQGAEVCVGGGRVARAGTYFMPTLLNQVTASMAITQSEVFGPVATLVPFEDEEHAVRLANDTPFGLGATVFGPQEAAEAAGRKLRAGMIGINKSCGGAEGTPWVGAQESGYGFHGGIEGHRQFAQVRIVSTRK